MDVDGEGDRSENPRIMERDSDSLKDQISEPSWFTPKRLKISLVSPLYFVSQVKKISQVLATIGRHVEAFIVNELVRKHFYFRLKSSNWLVLFKQVLYI